MKSEKYKKTNNKPYIPAVFEKRYQVIMCRMRVSGK
jgi:hypothetical protein